MIGQKKYGVASGQDYNEYRLEAIFDTELEADQYLREYNCTHDHTGWVVTIPYYPNYQPASLIYLVVWDDSPVAAFQFKGVADQYANHLRAPKNAPSVSVDPIPFYPTYDAAYYSQI